MRSAIRSRVEKKGENCFSFRELLRNREKRAGEEGFENVKALSLLRLGGESLPLDVYGCDWKLKKEGSCIILLWRFGGFCAMESVL